MICVHCMLTHEKTCVIPIFYIDKISYDDFKGSNLNQSPCMCSFQRCTNHKCPWCSNMPSCFVLFRDVLILSVVDALTCLLAGFAIFSTLGYLAHTQDMDVDDVVKEGTFEIYIQIGIHSFHASYNFFRLLISFLNSFAQIRIFCLSWSGSKPCDTLFLKEFFRKS